MNTEVHRYWMCVHVCICVLCVCVWCTHLLPDIYCTVKPQDCVYKIKLESGTASNYIIGISHREYRRVRNTDREMHRNK